MRTLPKSYRKFKENNHQVWEAYDQLGLSAAEAGPLDQTTRELIKLGMAAARGSRSTVQSHTHRALEAGASPSQVEHAIILGITTIGFPSMMAALSWANGAIEDHQ